jgi:hypothetical protein
LSVTVYAAEPVVTVVDIIGQQENSLPQFAPTDIQTTVENGVALLLKTFEVAPDVNPDRLIESGVTQDGVEYELRDIRRQNLPDGQEMKIVSQAVTVLTESEMLEDILPLLSDSIDYAENGFTGRLLLNASGMRVSLKVGR